MAEPERFFASPAFGDVGTPSTSAATSSQTPKKKRTSTTFAPPAATATPGKIKKRQKELAVVVVAEWPKIPQELWPLKKFKDHCRDLIWPEDLDFSLAMEKEKRLKV